jgi:hypothetical protein
MKGRRKGAPKTGGRKAGTPNKTTAEIREFARSYGRRAIKELAWLAFHAESGATQVMAIKELLNRGFGKAPQAVAVGVDTGVSRVIVRWRDESIDSLPCRDPLEGLPPRPYPARPLRTEGKSPPRSPSGEP